MENENLILEYLQGNLPIEEQKAFQKRLDDEPTLMQEYLSLKPMYSYLIEKKARPEYTAELDRLGDKYFLPKEKKTKSNKLKLLIIALVALLAVFTLYHLINKTNQSLYESHADHFALHLVQKSSANEFALDAENAFNSQKYEKAKNALEQYLVKNHMAI